MIFLESFNFLVLFLNSLAQLFNFLEKRVELLCPWILRCNLCLLALGLSRHLPQLVNLHFLILPELSGPPPHIVLLFDSEVVLTHFDIVRKISSVYVLLSRQLLVVLIQVAGFLVRNGHLLLLGSRFWDRGAGCDGFHTSKCVALVLI